jgi:opacity protein-like surface antigen
MKLCAMTAALVLLLPLSREASAADDRTASVGGLVSALNIRSDTALSFTGSFEFQFNHVVGLELEATMAPKLKSRFPNGPVILGGSTSTAVLQGGFVSSLIYPAPTYSNFGGRVVIFSNNVRIAIPTTVRRLEPFFVAGGGLASVRRNADLVYTPIVLTPSRIGVIPPTPSGGRPITQRVTSSALDLALTLGGGLSIRTASQLRVDVDLRLIRLLGSPSQFGDEDQNVGRFGVGARYRF